MVALTLNQGVNHLIVEELGMPRFSRDTPVVIVEEPPEEAELTLIIEHFDPHEIAKLAHECAYLAGKARQITLYLRVQQRLHFVARKLRLYLAASTSRV